MKIKDVDSEVKWINLKARVVKKPIARTVYSRFGNNPLGLSTSTISDDTIHKDATLEHPNKHGLNWRHNPN